MFSATVPCMIQGFCGRWIAPRGTVTVPSTARSEPASAASSADFPLPTRPRTATSSPAPIRRSTSVRQGCASSAEGQANEAPASSMSFVGAASPVGSTWSGASRNVDTRTSATRHSLRMSR